MHSLESKNQNVTLIVAVSENNAIGKDNALIWHLRDDLRRFKRLTSGHCIVMGRKTFEGFPSLLPYRTHIVVTRQAAYKAPKGVVVVNTLEAALRASKEDCQPFVIGGGEIYRQAMPLANTIMLTRVHGTFEADTFFPEIDLKIWRESSRERHKKDDKNGVDFSFITYQRRG